MQHNCRQWLPFNGSHRRLSRYNLIVDTTTPVSQSEQTCKTRNSPSPDNGTLSRASLQLARRGHSFCHLPSFAAQRLHFKSCSSRSELLLLVISHDNTERHRLCLATWKLLERDKTSVEREAARVRTYSELSPHPLYLIISSP